MATSARATSITDVGGANQGPSVLYDYSGAAALTARHRRVVR